MSIYVSMYYKIRCHFGSSPAASASGRQLASSPPCWSPAVTMSGRKATCAASLAAAEARELKRSPSETVAVKKCYDNFKNYDEAEIYLDRDADGNTIFDEVVERVRAKKLDKKLPLGGNFYRRVKQRRPKKSKTVELKAPVPPQPVNKHLMAAAIASRQKNQS